jgi:hypothetical protein
MNEYSWKDKELEKDFRARFDRIRANLISENDQGILWNEVNGANDSAENRSNTVEEFEVNYNIKGYDRAQKIVDNFSSDEIYLRSLISNVTGNGEFADNLDFRGLLREGHKIKGIASKILKSKKE